MFNTPKWAISYGSSYRLSLPDPRSFSAEMSGAATRSGKIPILLKQQRIRNTTAFHGGSAEDRSRANDTVLSSESGRPYLGQCPR